VGESSPAPASGEVLDTRFTFAAPGFWAMLSIHAGALLAFHPAAHPTPLLVGLVALTFVPRAFCVSAGFHRYFSHRSFKTTRVFQFLLAFVGGMAVMRGALWWAAHHRAHHAHSDKPGDPHSPRDGALWSHMGWFTARGNQPTQDRLITDFSRYPELVWLNAHEWVPIAVLVGSCLGGGALFGWATGGDPARAAFAAWVWGANVSSVLLCHAVFSINSVSHLAGSRRYPETQDDSTNNFFVGLIAFGEGWHNNHHRWPARARLGERLWEIDISWYGIKILRALRIVWDVRG
jgi:stearoyl-CoA desaturase (Delta-9 desaturase)